MKKHLILKVLCEPPRNRQDIFPYYSRLIVTLSKYMPTIRDSVVEYVSYYLLFIIKIIIFQLIKQFKKIIALGTKDLELRTRVKIIKFVKLSHYSRILDICRNL